MAEEPPDSADDPEGSPRRYVRKHGWGLARLAGEYAEAGDEGGFQAMLAKLKIFPGTPRYDAAMEGYHRFCRERQR